MKKLMTILTAVSAILFAISEILYFTLKSGVLLSLAITFGTIFYHFAMRLAVGVYYNKRYDRIDFTGKQFQPLSFERGLYKKLRVKKWKKFMPTYYPESFDVKQRTAREMLKNSCGAEIVHKTIMILSFLPLLLIIPFGEPIVFILTSIIAALIDSVFVIIQRYNRPRLLRLAERQEKKEKIRAMAD